jgi:hypothetical protein
LWPTTFVVGVEIAEEHRRGEEGDGAQRLLAGVLEVVSHRRRQDEDAARPDRQGGAVFQIELAGAGDDILRLLGGVGVPAEAAAGFGLAADVDAGFICRSSC